MIRMTLAIALVLLCAPSFADMRITFFDAGQADAALIQIDQTSGEPLTIVVDGGNHDSDLRDHLPARMTGDSTVELVVLSHPHHDHLGALDWLIQVSGLTVERLWWNGESHTVNSFGHLTAAIASEGVIATRPQEAFYHFIGAPNVTLRVFNNGGEFPDTGGDNINNDSLVFQVINEPANGVRVTALFTGDIEDAQGELLVDQFGTELQSDIVKIPHHGSGDLFDELPAAIGADFAIASSTGTNSTFMHPRKTTLDLFEAEGEIFCTCIVGTGFHHITATVDTAGNITVTPDQVPYLVWERDSNGDLQNVPVTP